MGEGEQTRKKRIFLKIFLRKSRRAQIFFKNSKCWFSLSQTIWTMVLPGLLYIINVYIIHILREIYMCVWVYLSIHTHVNISSKICIFEAHQEVVSNVRILGSLGISGPWTSYLLPRRPNQDRSSPNSFFSC